MAADHSPASLEDDSATADGKDKLPSLDAKDEVGPTLRHGECKQVKKGEDLVLVEEGVSLGGREVSCFCVSSTKSNAGNVSLLLGIAWMELADLGINLNALKRK